MGFPAAIPAADLAARLAVEATLLDDETVALVVVPVNEATLLEMQQYVGDRLAALDLADMPAVAYDVEVEIKAVADTLMPRAFLALAGDPAPDDIAAGTWRVTKRISDGRFSIWANDGGSMVDLLTLIAS